MCGIIGYTGKKQVKPIIIDALTTLEYRGYDSAGMAVSNDEAHRTDVYKCAGRVRDLSKATEDKNIDSTCGIGHTRWATHGGVCDANAHPHSQGKVTVVHNGIIENYKDLIDEFNLSPNLKSETDTEVAAAILDHYYEKTHDPKQAVTKAVKRLKGTFALVILFSDIPDVIYSIRNVSPIVATLSDEGAMLASDLTALCQFTDQYFVVPEYTIVELKKDSISMWTLDGKEVTPEYLTMNWEKNSAEKNGYPFYMEKEIMEQPKAIRDTISGRTRSGIPNFIHCSRTVRGYAWWRAVRRCTQDSYSRHWLRAGSTCT